MIHPPSSGVVTYQSDRVEELVDQLVVELAAREQHADVPRPFVGHCVVLPTRNLETYLNFEIAARRGVAAGVDFQTMEQFLRLLLPDGDDDRPEVQILDQTAMTRIVLSVLDDDAVMQRASLEPVRRFIDPGPHADPAGVQRRKFQLAFRIARLFEEYGYSRRAMLEQWRQGETALDPNRLQHATGAHVEIERWQMALWRQLFGDDGRLTDTDDDRPWMTLPEAIYHYASSEHHQLQWPDQVHLFGHSYLPRFFRELFRQRRRREDHKLALYVMTPSLQHWSHGIAGDRDEDPVFDLISEDSILAGDEYPLALEVWGRAGRDYQRLLDDVSDTRLDVSADEPRPANTLLQHFQQVIRRMETASRTFVDEPFPQDRKSINFWSCASVQRECEAIASEIQEMMQVHDGLRFNDIGVVVQPGERTLYQTHLQAAFEQTGSIPCNVIDVEGTEANPLLEAVELLLHLPLGQFRRRQLLALLVHPCLVANYPEADDEAWMQWCDQVNIYQGAGGEELDDTYLKEDRFTWDQGMRRLVLGAFMTQPDPTSPRAFSLNDNHYLPHETEHGQLDTVAVLTMVVDELIGDARAARTDRRTLAEWMEYFSDQITRHLQPRDRHERRTRMQYLGMLAAVAESDACPDDEIGYRTAFEFAMAAMADIEDTRGQYLADGVVVSAFRPMRPIPFQVVFVTGLGEGKFPAPDPPDMLDLRRVKSRAHDVNPRYRDQYMFLETLITTRSRLYLSWVGRHPVTGDPIEPASAVHQLREMLLDMAPTDGEDADEIRQRLRERTEFEQQPLRRWDDRYFPQVFDHVDEQTIDAGGADAIPPRAPDDGGDEDVEERLWPNHHRQARREARVRQIRRRLDERLPDGYRPSIHELQTVLDEGVFAPLAQLVRWHQPTASRGRDEGETVVLQLRHLRNFLKCPLQGCATILLGLYDEELDDLLDVDHEPFESDFLTRLMLIRRAVTTAMAQQDLSRTALTQAFDDRAERARLAGELPAGVFFDAERDRCLATVNRYARGLRSADLAQRRLHRIRFGSTGRSREVDELRDPLTITVQVDDRPLHVELHGTIDAVDGDEMESLVLAAGRKAKPKYLIDGGIAQIALAALGFEISGHTTVVTNDGSANRLAVDTGGGEQARRYLSELLTDIFQGVHDYFLPVEVAAEVAADDIHDWARLVEKMKQPDYRGRPRVSSCYGPVRRWQQVESLPEDEARAIVPRRYAPFLEGLAELS